MAIVDDRTTNLDLPLPSQSNKLEDDIVRLRSCINMLDAAHTFAALLNKPTTIAGFAISDAYTKTEIDGRFTDLINGAPSGLNTLGEIAFQLQEDEGLAATLTQTVNNHIGSRGSAHGLATSSQAGFMSSADKTKMDAFDGAYYIPKNFITANTPPDAGTITIPAGATDGAIAIVDGYGLYKYSSTDTTIADGETVVTTSTGTGRWTLIAPAWDFVWTHLLPVIYEENRRYLELQALIKAPRTLKYTYEFGSIAGYSSKSQTFSFPNATITDNVLVNIKGGMAVGDYIYCNMDCWVSSAGIVTINMVNHSYYTASIPSLVFIITVTPTE